MPELNIGVKFKSIDIHLIHEKRKAKLISNIKSFYRLWQIFYGKQDEMREDWCFHLYSETCIKPLKVIKISITEIDFKCKQ